MSQRILIVESEPHAREGLRALLAGAGHEVSVAEDVAAGVARLASGPFDLLILDADLPGQGVLLTPLDLLRLARVAHKGTRAILVTNFAEGLPRDLGPQGMVAILERPVELAELQRMLNVVGSRAKGRTGVPMAEER